MGQKEEKEKIRALGGLEPPPEGLQIAKFQLCFEFALCPMPIDNVLGHFCS